MQNSSRTARSLQNAKVALAFYVLNLVLQFFSRKVFLDYLGNEVLGLNTTAQNLLGFLNLAELGIGTAVAYNLYKPLFDGDRQAINDIVSIQGWLYRRIACVVIAGAMMLVCVFPLIFAKAEVSLWYTPANGCRLPRKYVLEGEMVKMMMTADGNLPEKLKDKLWFSVE